MNTEPADDPAALRQTSPELIPDAESPELGRVVLADQAERDGVAGFLARIGRLAARDGIRRAVGSSGPVAP